MNYIKDKLTQLAQQFVRDYPTHRVLMQRMHDTPSNDIQIKVITVSESSEAKAAIDTFVKIASSAVKREFNRELVCNAALRSTQATVDILASGKAYDKKRRTANRNAKRAKTFEAQLAKRFRLLNAMHGND